MPDTLSEEQLYLDRASSELRALLDALDAVEQDFEVELANDILTIEFDDGDRFVVNSHRAARQIWMAALTSAWHFDFSVQDAHWYCSKTKAELWHVLGAQVAAKLRRPFELAPRS